MKNSKSMNVVTNRKGKRVRLMNPAEKAAKAAYELKQGVKYTNFGEMKTDENGNVLVLTEKERSYRSGMLDMRKAESKAWKAKNKAKFEHDENNTTINALYKRY